MRASQKPRVLLLHPPYGDFTYPYHSLSYVAAPLVGHFEVDVLDLNIIWIRHHLTKHRLVQWGAELRESLVRLEELTSWDLECQTRATHLVNLISICETIDTEFITNTFTSEFFYNYKTYLAALTQFRAFERLLSHFYRPFDFNTAFAIPPVIADSHEVIGEALGAGRYMNDVKEILERHCGALEYLFCGVSIPFNSHVHFGLATLVAVGERFQGCHTIAGGTAITDIYRNSASSEVLRRFGKICEHFYVGEAELGVLKYAEWCLGETVQLPEQVVSLREDAVERPTKKWTYVSLSGDRRFVAHDWSANPPFYDWIDWGLYLSPERQVNYSPSRGCFWNKCTFCDYGLNSELPAAPSRTMGADLAVQQIRTLQESGIQNVYFAVDALAVPFLVHFSRLAIDCNLGVSLSAELFLTPSFDCRLVSQLESAGFITASFGLESGSSRVLELMGKGKARVERVLCPAFNVFRTSSISLQPKFFFGFPGESDEERQATVDLLLGNKDVFSIVTRGNVFDLSPNSIVALNPTKFGIRNLRRRVSDDIGGGMIFETQSGPAPSLLSFRELNEQLKTLDSFERPWAGGIDTFHSKLYLKRFGRQVFHELRIEAADYALAHWRTVRVHSRYDMVSATENAMLAMMLNAPYACERHNFTSVVTTEIESLISVPAVPSKIPQTYDLAFR